MMDKETELRCEINLRFHEILWDTNLFTVVGRGSAVETLRKLVDAYYSNHRLKIPRVLICGKNNKSTMAHAFCNSIICKKVTYIESEFLDAPINSKYIFENNPEEKAVIVGNIENLTRNAVSTIWQYLAFGKCYYNTFQKNDWEIIHYDGVIILTAREKKLVPKEILKQIDIVVEVEEHQAFEIRQILEQKLKYMQIESEQESLNLLLNSCEKLEKMKLFKLGLISMMSDGRERLLKSDIEWAIEHYK
ncbi:MAG: hypothetical protein KAS96_10145 [Planctomycetes bacterium]|nr:hypothetical protein [Planctomycetota bacterium]